MHLCPTRVTTIVGRLICGLIKQANQADEASSLILWLDLAVTQKQNYAIGKYGNNCGKTRAKILRKAPIYLSIDGMQTAHFAPKSKGKLCFESQIV
jgi:hypothetical protein